MAYIGNAPGSIRQGRRAVYEFTSTANQTAFSGVDDNGLTLDLLQANDNDVYLNGVRLIITDDYTISGDILTLVSGAAAGDKLIVMTQDEIANDASYSKAASDSRYINYDGDVVNGTIQMGGGPGNNITFADNNKIVMGTGNDLEIYHSGTNSYIDDVGEGSLFLRSGTTYIQNAAGTKTSILTNAGAGQTLYHNNTPVFVTTSTGIDVTGTVTADGLSVEGSASGNFISTIKNTHNSNGSGLKVMGGDDANTTAFRITDYNNNALVEVQGGGNVGIGTNSPISALDVLNGGSTYTSGLVLRNGSSTSEATSLYHDNTGSTTTVLANRYGSASSGIKLILQAASGSPVTALTALGGGNVGIGTTSPAHKLDVAGTTKAEQYLLDAVAKDISDTAVDVFIYDTRKDSDGGAWRKRTQHTSWYSETLNTATRGARKEFPAVAVIVLETNKTVIYDGDDPDMPMWMTFNNPGAGSSQMIGELSNSCVTMLNGNLGVGSRPYDFYLVNFIEDKGYQYSNNSLISGTYKGDISTRNVTTMGWIFGTVPNIISRTINDVAMTVLPNAPINSATGLPVPTIALATSSGVSVIKDNGTVVDVMTSNSYGVAFTKNYELVHTVNDASSTFSNHIREIPLADTTTTATRRYFRAGNNTGSVPSINSTNSEGTAKILVTLPNNTLAVASNGTSKALNILQEVPNAPATGMIAYVASDYNTGWMNGDIKLATLSDTDDTNVTGPSVLTNYDLSSGDLTGFTLTSADSGGGIYSNQNPIYVATNLAGIGNTGSVRQNVTVEAGKKYIVGYYCATRSASNYRLGIYFSHVGGSLTFDDSVGAGEDKLYYWTSDYTGTTLLQFRGRGGGYGTFTNFIFDEVEEDRSVNDKGLQVFGTVTKTAVATGAELMGYSGFSSGNYLQQPYNSDLDFGTGDFSATFWFNGSGAGNTNLWERGAATGQNFGILTVNGYIYLTGFGANIPIGSPHANAGDASWGHVVLLRKAGVWNAYLNGNDTAWAYTNAANLTNTSAVLHIGGNVALTSFANAKKLALMRFSPTVPSSEQIKKIYNDEKHLFQENAKATLYGSSDAVTALAYDDDTELLHVGTSAGRSVFQGLRRIDNTTDAVGAAISASNGMVAED